MNFNDITTYKEKGYRKFIKDRCVICGVHIGDSWVNYFIRGNWCVDCNAKAGKAAVARNKRLGRNHFQPTNK